MYVFYILFTPRRMNENSSALNANKHSISPKNMVHACTKGWLNSRDWPSMPTDCVLSAHLQKKNTTKFQYFEEKKRNFCCRNDVSNKNMNKKTSYFDMSYMSSYIPMVSRKATSRL